ncbi:MAG: PepSY-like domain-containing protein [Bacteroidetes bacterium]|nr:PepSY-like domain-containing protein [Bacteroidota bacterium]
MKKMICISCMAGFLTLISLTTKASVNEQVLKSFHSLFPRATHIKWVEYPDHFYVAFNQNEIQVRVYYDTLGNILNAIRYYKQQDLPLNILQAVKKSYPGKKITGVTETSSKDQIEYYVHLEDQKNIMIVKTGAIVFFELVDKFRKA